MCGLRESWLAYRNTEACLLFFSHAATEEMNASLLISKLSRCLFHSLPPLCVSCQVLKNPSHASNCPPLLLYLANLMLLSWQDASYNLESAVLPFSKSS